MTPCPKCGAFLCERVGNSPLAQQEKNLQSIYDKAVALNERVASVFGDMFGSRRNECRCRVCGTRFTQAAEKEKTR